MSDKHPLRIILSNLIPRDILPDLKNRIQNQDWDSFFTSLVGVGSVSMISSLCIIILAAIISRLSSDTIDLVGLVLNILTNLTLLAIIGYILALLMLHGIKSTVKGEAAFSDQEERVRSYLNLDRDRMWMRFGAYAVNVILSVAFLTLIIVFRSGLVLSTNILSSATGFVQEILLLFVIIGLDLAYLGLVLILVGQLYETTKSLKRL